MKFNIRKQVRNKYFWLSIVSLIILTAEQFNLEIISSDFEEYINSVLTILVGIGILNNNASDGLGK
ncbi:phage holin [Intestinibacter sp.]|uniref:phage holin n=1 Tax=Intestinibacter sp. TaxID=1965304 RepID=UPI002A75CC38|nr:phage holin [Intestinibacter sp.]MDY2735433.1 phage holin [Intestinibacter sp.]